MLVGGATRGVGATFRVLCYALAPEILNVLPGCGSPLAGVGSLILTVIGFSAVHRISTGKAALAVLLPVVLCCTCVLVFAVTVGAGMLAAFGGMHH
jgi:hypothetical protein